MLPHYLTFSAVPAGHPGERRGALEPRKIKATFRQAAAEAELVRDRLDQFNSKCDDRCVVTKAA